MRNSNDPHVQIDQSFFLRADYVFAGGLYSIGERLHLAASSPDQRQRVRQWESLPILEALHDLLTNWQTRGRFLPRSSAGEVLAYTLGLWGKLCRFAHDGRFEIVSEPLTPTLLIRQVLRDGQVR